MLEGAHFTIAPTIFAKLFGPKGGIRVFSVGFSFAGVASLTQIIINKLLLSKIGFSGMCYLYTGFCLLALILLFAVFEETKVEFEPIILSHKQSVDDLYTSYSSMT